MFQINCEKAAIGAKQVYTENIDLGTTEFRVSIEDDIQALDIAGTNEGWDWVKNGNLFSKRGIKKSSYAAAMEIAKYLRSHGLINFDMPLIVRGHSKGGATAIAYHKIIGEYLPYYKSSACVAFAPARCLRYWSDRSMSNTVVFTDPDDYVSEILGRISFGLPICYHYKAEDNHFGFSLGDHPMDNWVSYTKKHKIFIDFEKK